VAEEPAPDGTSRLRHERDDAHYVRRLGGAASDSTVTDASAGRTDEALADETPSELRTTRKPHTSRRALMPRRPRGSAAPAESTSARRGAAAAPASARRQSWARRHPGALIAATVTLVVLAIGSVAWWSAARAANHVYGGRPLYVNPDSAAARAAESSATAAQAEAAGIIAAQPTGIWLTPEKMPIDRVRDEVGASMADSATALPIFVIYGITDRDCGGSDANAGQSAGGLTPAQYLTWVEQIAAGIGKGRAIVILEPDSIALSVACTDPEGRLRLVSRALDRLDASGAIVYLDGGHSDWLPARQMAELLRTAGVDRARGFATNVSNTQTTEAEHAYAARVSAVLGGSHAVIDTSRNGSGPPADGEWCNPPGVTLGERPKPITDDLLDAVLWMKPPGESDGRCNGGPPAGDWWAGQAVALAGTG